MTHIFQQVDDVILKASKSMCDISLANFFGKTKKELRDIYHSGDYNPPVFYSFPDDVAHKLESIKDPKEMSDFYDEYGEKVSDEDQQLFGAITYIWCMTEDDRLAQKMVDDLYYNFLKKDFYLNQSKFIDALIRRESSKSIARCPRNKHYDVAVRMLKRTWERHPGAPKKSLFKAVCNDFSGGVSVDSLKRWAKAEGLGPDPSVKKTSFSLVRD